MGVFKKLRLTLDTLRYLRARQVFYQIYYRLKKKTSRRSSTQRKNAAIISYPLVLKKSIPAHKSFHGNSFLFLNLPKSFESGVDWNYSGHGKLWTYNLNYFDFLHQEGIDEKDAVELIESFCNYSDSLKDGVEPYSISLRGINWIKFFSYQKIQNPRFDSILFDHYLILEDNLEYHLLGNHLLENGFSLLFGAYYFKNENFYKKASHILTEELNEQILADGGHFELSTMYHQILLFRLLECVNLVTYNNWKEDQLLSFLKKKAGAMLGWLEATSFRNGEVPMVNDAAFGIAPTTEQIMAYANRIETLIESRQLSESGYRMIRSDSWEMVLDVGNIGPDYIPGHAHSDTLNFVLQVKDHPVIVDVGTSTYENGVIRLNERSTQSHNTVMIDDRQQSEVWASFRVGRRARIIRLEEGGNEITAAHDGYKTIGMTHQRKWVWSQNEINIRDTISGARRNVDASAWFHFHPSIEVEINDRFVTAGTIKMQFAGHDVIEIAPYNFPAGFDKVVAAKRLRVSFKNDLQTIISC